jgi:hypothetical protein
VTVRMAAILETPAGGQIITLFPGQELPIANRY